MEPQTTEAVPAPTAAAVGPPLSVWQRTVAVFARPTAAWAGYARVLLAANEFIYLD